MLSFQRNKLINLLLQFEQALNDAKNEIDDKTNALHASGKFSEASEHSNHIPIIERNIISIKKQLKKL